jgi:ribonuclease HI
MEAFACRDGLKLARQHGEQRVILETDCLELVNLWKKRDSQRSVVDPILKEIQDLELAFQEFSFVYVSRSCNKVAHVLAKQVSSTQRSEKWHVTPLCVADLMMFEASAG